VDFTVLCCENYCYDVNSPLCLKRITSTSSLFTIGVIVLLLHHLESSNRSLNVQTCFCPVNKHIDIHFRPTIDSRIRDRQCFCHKLYQLPDHSVRSGSLDGYIVTQKKESNKNLETPKDLRVFYLE